MIVAQGTLIFTPAEREILRRGLPQALIRHGVHGSMARMISDLLAALDELTKRDEPPRIERSVIAGKMFISIPTLKRVLRVAGIWKLVRVSREPGETNVYQVFYERARVVIQAQLASDPEPCNELSLSTRSSQAQLATTSAPVAKEFCRSDREPRPGAQDAPAAAQIFDRSPGPQALAPAPGNGWPAGPPGSAQNEPGSAQNEPGSAQNEPGSAQNEPTQARAPAYARHGKNGKDDGVYRSAAQQQSARPQRANLTAIPAIKPWGVWGRSKPIDAQTLVDPRELAELFAFANRRWKLHAVHRLRFFTLARSVARRFLEGPDPGQERIDNPGGTFTGALKRRAWYGSQADEDWAQSALAQLDAAASAFPPLPPGEGQGVRGASLDEPGPDRQTEIDKLRAWQSRKEPRDG